MKPELVSSAVQARPWLAIVGIGEDGRAGLSQAAIAALEAAEIVFGGARHLQLAAPLGARSVQWPSPMTDAYPQILARRGKPTTVLATGDPFHYGVGAELARLISADEIVCFPQASAFSLAAARMGWPLSDCECVSLHGRAVERIIPLLQPRTRIFALSWDGSTPQNVARILVERGFGASAVTVLEAMGGRRERMRMARASAFDLENVDPLNTLAIEIADAPQAHTIPLTPGLDDSWFANDGQLTKAEVRAITIAALAPRAGELLWDIGAGSGSVGIEWVLRHRANRCIALERHADRAQRARANALANGAVALDVRDGRAPEALEGWPAPDAVFIGGGAAEPGVFECAWEALREGGRLVVNAVTLETEARLAVLHAQHGGVMRRIALSRLELVGGRHGWRPAMPITQWAARKP